MAKNKKWIQKINMKKGLVRSYLRKKYGNRAFNTKGNIKIEYLNRAYRNATPIWRKRLSLARNLKKIARKR